MNIWIFKSTTQFEVWKSSVSLELCTLVTWVDLRDRIGIFEKKIKYLSQPHSSKFGGRVSNVIIACAAWFYKVGSKKTTIQTPDYWKVGF